MTATNFAIGATPWSVDAGFSPTAPGSGGGTAFVDGTCAPGLVDRNTADTVGFAFVSSPTNSITPGCTSNVLIIETNETNATNYITGSAVALDGGAATFIAFEPGVLPPDFTISASPASQTITSRQTATYTITLTAVNGLTGDVALICSGNPPDSVCGISPNPVALNGTTTATVVLLRGPVNQGTFTLTFTGELGSISHATNVSLTVNSESQPRRGR